MKSFILCLALALCINIVVGRAVQKNDEKKHDEHYEEPDDVANALEYERYLKEVVSALETDPEFRKKLDNATDVDIRSGKIANELAHVNHRVRTQLDEIKRREIERLRLAARKTNDLNSDFDRERMKIPEIRHVDHNNVHTFEIEDLKKLIEKTSEDLAEADKQRRTDFKEYELQKEFEKQEKMRAMDEEHRKQYEEEIKKQHQKHNQHERMHHPGNKAQLEEVWEKQDHMDVADFDPKTFFMMHDLDGNNYWDETEVKALFVKELDKVYQSGLPEDDMRERVEEMERMREHVFREADTNHDSLISLEEFIAQTKRDEFNRDPNWDTVDNQPQFTHEEYLEFERRRQEEVQRLIAQGMLPPHPNMPQGYYPNQQVPQYQYQQQQQQQQQQHQQQHQGGYQQHQPVQLNQNQVYQHVDQNAQHGQGHPNQAYHQPAGQAYNPGQVNQGQANSGQINANHVNAQYQQPNAQYQQGNAQYNAPSPNAVNSNNINSNIPNQNVNANSAGQSGNQQQFQQQNVPPVAAAAAQNQANVQYQSTKTPDINLNQINPNQKADTKN